MCTESTDPQEFIPTEHGWSSHGLNLPNLERFLVLQSRVEIVYTYRTESDFFYRVAKFCTGPSRRQERGSHFSSFGIAPASGDGGATSALAVFVALHTS